MRGEVSKREAIVMWRGLYHDHWLLGAHKDTMPRRKWLKLIGTTIAASALARPSSGQQPSGIPSTDVTIDEEPVHLKVGKALIHFLPSLPSTFQQETCSPQSPSSPSQVVVFPSP